MTFRINRFTVDEARSIAGAGGSKFKRRMDQAFSQVETQVNGILQALGAAQEDMADIPAVTITTDYAGTVSPAAQLPKVIACQRVNNGVDVTSTSTWSAVARNGGVTCSIGAATGILTISAVTSADVVDVTSVRTINGLALTLTKALTVNFTSGSAPATGSSGGSTSTTSIFSAFAGTSMSIVTGEITATVGSSGQVQLSAPLNYTVDPSSPTGSFAIKAIWQWWDGASWVDQGTETSSSVSAKVSPLGGNYSVSDGAISVSRTKSALGVGTSQKFRLEARQATGSRNIYLYGTASAVGS